MEKRDKPSGAPSLRNQPTPKLLDDVLGKLRLLHYARSTEELYLKWIRDFLRFHRAQRGQWVHPREMGAAEVEQFLTSLAIDRHISPSTQNQALSAILFLYHQVLEVQLGRLNGIRAARTRRLPVVLSREEVAQVLAQVEGAGGQFRLMAQLMYGSGLRINEVCQLRVKDIDFDCGQIKSDKDRHHFHETFQSRCATPAGVGAISRRLSAATPPEDWRDAIHDRQPPINADQRQ